MMLIALVRAHYYLPTEELFIPLPFRKLNLCKGFPSTVQASLLCEFVLFAADSHLKERSSVSSDSATPALAVWTPNLKFQLSFNFWMTNSQSSQVLFMYFFYFQTAWWRCFESWGVVTSRCAHTTAEKLSTFSPRSHLSITTLAGCSHTLAELTLNWLNTHR